MTSLYYVTEHIKLVAKWSAIGIAGIIILVFLFRFLIFIKNTIAPTPPPPPTVTWGKLPQIIFPQSTIPSPNFTYSINTLSGNLPNLPDRMLVNLVATPEASLQSLNNAQKTVQNAGFSDDGIRISETIYQWINPDSPVQKLQYDIVSKDFTLTSNYLADTDIVTGNNLPDDIDATQTAEDFLSNMDAFPADFEATKSAVTFLAFQNNALQKATSLSNAQVIRIDFFQQDLNNTPIYYPEYPNSPIYVLVGGGQNNGSIIEAHYSHHIITNVSGSYPIYNTTEAFNLLKQGKSYIASYSGNGTAVRIRNVTLGYYIDKNTTTYVMPIFIFEGNDNFVAYVSAIKAQLISN